MCPRKGKNAADVFAKRLRVLHDRKAFQQCNEASYFRLIQAFLALADQNGISKFEAPDGRRQNGMAFEADQNAIGILTCFIRKAPCQSS